MTIRAKSAGIIIAPFILLSFSGNHVKYEDMDAELELDAKAFKPGVRGVPVQFYKGKFSK